MSTSKQDLDRQIDALTAAGIPLDRIYLDKKSGATVDHETTAGGRRASRTSPCRPGPPPGTAVAAAGQATTQQPETLLSIYLTDDEGHLVGAVSLLAALRADAAAPLGDLADDQPVFLYPEADIVDVTVRVADFNLISLTIVDHDHRLIGLVTFDDVLAAAMPESWRRRGLSMGTIPRLTPATAE